MFEDRFAGDVHFQRVLNGQHDQVDLATVALEIARDEYPELSPLDWRTQIAAYALEVERSRSDPRAIVTAINSVLFRKHGLTGDTNNYYDPRNSYLNQVVQRRLGIPLTLSIIYLTVANEVGLELDGVGLPCHFVLKYEDDWDEFFVDAFNEGRVLSRVDCANQISKLVGAPVELEEAQLAPVAVDQVVLRLLGNLKAIFLKREDAHRALRIQRRICAVSPNESEQVDLACLQLKTQNPIAAIELLEPIVDRLPGEIEHGAREVLRIARKMHASRN